MGWIKGLADYGVDIVSLAVMAFVLVKVLPQRKLEPEHTEDPNPELIKVIQENTRSNTEMVVVLRQQGELIKDQGSLIKDQGELTRELLNRFTAIQLSLMNRGE